MLVKLTMITYSSTIGGVVVGNGRTQSNQLRSLAGDPQLLLQTTMSRYNNYFLKIIIAANPFLSNY